MYQPGIYGPQLRQQVELFPYQEAASRPFANRNMGYYKLVALDHGCFARVSWS